MGMTVGALLAMSASAATITVAGGGTTDNCSLANFTVSVACDGDFAVANQGGNVAGSDINGLFFADGAPISGWAEIDAIGSVNSTGVQTGANGLFRINTTNTSSGTWELINPFAFDASKYYVFALKGATDQVAYFMDIASLFGNWTNGDLQTPNGQMNLAGLSNIRLFEAPGNPSVVPLPAAGWLLLAGVGGLAAMRRKKTA
jgi:hypothetical protein